MAEQHSQLLNDFVRVPFIQWQYALSISFTSSVSTSFHPLPSLPHRRRFGFSALPPLHSPIVFACEWMRVCFCSSPIKCAKRTWRYTILCVYMYSNNTHNYRMLQNRAALTAHRFISYKKHIIIDWTHVTHTRPLCCLIFILAGFFVNPIVTGDEFLF